MEHRLPVAITASGVFVDLLTCPASHKYEICDVFFGGDHVHAIEWGLLWTASGGSATHFMANESVPATSYVAHHRYGGIVLQPGDKVQGIWLATGVSAAAVMLTYIDVDYT